MAEIGARVVDDDRAKSQKHLSRRCGTMISETTKHNTMKTSALTVVSRSIIVIALQAVFEIAVSVMG